MSLQPINYGVRERSDLLAGRPMWEREYKVTGFIRRLMPDGEKASILDIGCGDGSFLRQLDEALGRPYEYHGVDFSDHMISAAQTLPYEFRRCNLEEAIPYGDASFDLVYAGEVIEHIYNPDFMLEECRRVLKPRGLLVLSTPNLQAWYNRVLFLFGIQPIFYEVSTKSTAIGAGILRRVKQQSAPVGHVRLFNHRALTDLLKNEGFDVVASAGAKFQSLPKAVQVIDGAFNLRPRLSSVMVVAARRDS